MKQKDPNKNCKIAINKTQSTSKNPRKCLNNSTRSKIVDKRRARDQ